MKLGKKFKGMLGLALSAMLTLGTVSVNAETTDRNNPALPDPTRTGSITIHKYGVSAIPNPGTPADGLEIEDTTGLGTPLPNIEFDIYRVDDNITSVDQITDENKEKLDTIKTDEYGIATLGDLPLGTYYVEEVRNAAIQRPVDPFLVSIPMAHPTGKEWIYDVHVYPKNVVDNGIPKIDKSINNSGNNLGTAEIGQEVTWVIETEIPKDIATALKYKVIDELDSRLTYKGHLQVSFTNASGQLVELHHYEHYDKVEPSQEKGGVLEITFNEAGKRLLATALKEGQEELPKVQISFRTVINNGAHLGDQIQNNATLEYTNTVNKDVEIDVPNSGNTVPEVHISALILEKVDASNSNIKLDGAKFKIYPSLEDATNGSNAIQNPNGSGDWEVITDTNGIAMFKGIAYGTYYIVETEAPKYDSNNDGIKDKSYNLLKAPLEVTVNAASYNNKVVVENRKFTLPVTGGVGTVIFTLGGLAIMGAAAFLYMRATRRA